MNRLQLFAYDNNEYADFTGSASRAVAGKDILLAIWNADGSKLLAISGQQGLTINRSSEAIEITSKDTKGGWKSKLAGMKEWSIENEGLYVPNDESHTLLSKAFDESEPVCVKVINGRTQKGMFGGLAVITDYPMEAPFDEAMTYSLTLEGMGALVDLMVSPPSQDIMPEGSGALGQLTVVSLEGEAAGQTMVYVNPIKEAENKYKYKAGDSVDFPAYLENCSSMTDWDGKAAISATAGTKVLIVECDAENRAKKAGKVIAAAKAGV